MAKNKKRKPGRRDTYKMIKPVAKSEEVSEFCPNCFSTHTKRPINCIGEARRKDEETHEAMVKYIKKYFPAEVITRPKDPDPELVARIREKVQREAAEEALKQKGL